VDAKAIVFATATLLPFSSSLIYGDEPKGQEKPDARPGWIIVEEDIWYPLRYGITQQFHHAREQFRQKEEKAAAKELVKAAALLKIAHGHATPDGAKVLDDAARDMAKLAKDLESGKVASTRRFDATLHKLHYALAAHHYFKAADHVGKDQLQYAGQHLETAAHYLSNAMTSAEHEYGKDVIIRIDRIDEHGRVLSEGEIVEKNKLAEDLGVLKKELETLGKTIENVKPEK